MQVEDVIDDGRAPSDAHPGRARAARAGMLLLLGAVVGLAGGQAWAQRSADADASSQVRLRAVLTSARLVQDLGTGPRVKVVGSLVNAGPRHVVVVPAVPGATTQVVTPGLDPAGSTTFTVEVPFVCRGPVTTPPPDLVLRATTDDGAERRVVVSLVGDQVWSDLSLVCLARATP